MQLVKVTFRNEHYDVVADTIEELKKKFSEEHLEGISIEEWRLFQFGLELLDAPETKLEKLKVDDGEIQLNLVGPEDLFRSGSRQIKNQTDKTRFIVRKWKDDFEMLEIEPMQKKTMKLKSANLFSANQKFGIVTSIKCDEPGNRSVQFDVYEVNRNGYVVLQKSKDEESDVSVCLVPENSTEPSKDGVQLQSTDAKTYDEAHMMNTSRERRDFMAQLMNAGLQAGARVAGEAAGAAVEAAIGL